MKKAGFKVISQRYAHAVHLTEMQKSDFFLARKRSDLEREEQQLGSRARGGGFSTFKPSISLKIAGG